MTPAEELRTAAAKLRPSSPAVAEHTAWVKIKPEVAEALTEWLEAQERTWSIGHTDHAFCPTQQCSQQAALAVARAINGGEQR
ncbi:MULTISPECIES: hypothetical protein [Streptomyces]|uniref:Uncharacterized protein n=1 Tax=Streptomyces europaeiscabiei TaxID=146819 RepID=A0ABU4P212_9ACTN|nr:hypothetical protein [Streptomyces europaeiscabiei]MDX2528015.1 hypothetical protein [Streptomyces europaeiscabiei]MDX3550129.1 hypothetical protein [Streptomyces europaeiscabiei]MDX3558809.1 hypothetical protein [Streptomyces europaeiscabiei]MDX3707255.1 hypothetical protein [Streptomyces europaeiscabiei]MDX3835629.1 hypothetical protein [Streptomyces europaeiscabiei]